MASVLLLLVAIIAFVGVACTSTSAPEAEGTIDPTASVTDVAGPTPTFTSTPILTTASTPSLVLSPTATPTATGPIALLVVPTPEGGATLTWEFATHLLNEAYELQLQGRLQEAVEAYQSSIATFPTAEAHTYLGWTYSWMGRYDNAIEEAQKAINLDPGYGNPYNDIGTHLIDQGMPDDAIPWLEKAIAAVRYETPHFPYLNLGRIRVAKGEWDLALEAYRSAVRLAPDLELPPPEAGVVDFADLPPEAAPSGEEAVPSQITKAIESYLRAWNGYDAEAVIERSTPTSDEATQALLMHLANAEIRRWTTELVEVDLLYMQGGLAVVDARLSVGGAPMPTAYLLAITEGRWKVVGQVLVES